MIECVLLEGAVLTARKKITKEKKYNQKDEKMNGKNTKQPNKYHLHEG